MALKFAPLALGLLHISAAMPAITLQDLEVADDTMSVGSYIREARAAAPDDYHKTYEDEGDGEIGYSRKKAGGGKKGYQHFDSFHKKAGDHYEFEKQDSFGLEEKGQDGAHSHPHEQRARRPRAHARRQSEAASYEEPEYARYTEEEPSEADVEEAPRKNKKRRPLGGAEVNKNHVHYEELKEGAHDGNGGVEAIGHDPADYTLPQKYTYGSAEEYDF